MKNVLFAACTVVALAMGACAASADDALVTVSPDSVVHNLQRQDYHHISPPVRSGRFYEVKAINRQGHKIKLYIDAHSGRIVDVKR